VTPPDPNFEARVRANFALQGIMATLGATILSVKPGAVEIALLPRPELSQQNGFTHAGAVATILDSACGYSAVSLMPANVDALTVEFKINLLRPAVGKRLIARGRVIKAGQTLTVCTGDCFAETDEGEKIVATMQNTVMTIRERS
jgi:uncharacterized protein (TIGR00369 family)